MIRVGLIGCGFIAKKHLKTLTRFDEMDLISVSDLKQDNMKEVVNLYQKEINRKTVVVCYTDYHDLLKHSKVDLVIISVVSGLHAEIIKKSLSYGKHIIVEKPLALSLKDIDEIQDLLKTFNKKVLVCHQLRYRPLLQKVKTLIQKGYFGEPYFGIVSLRLNRSPDYFLKASWKGTWEKDGGMLINQGIHLIDLLLWFMGDVQSVYGEITTKIKNKETEDVAAGILSFKNEAKGLIEANTITKPNNHGYFLSIFAKKGSICIGGKGFNEIEHAYIEDYPRLKEELLQVSEQVDERYLMYQDFLKAMKNHTPYLMTPSEGKKALETIFALYQSTKSQEPVTLPLTDFSTKDMIDK